jgi:hypothetical protein
MTEDDVVAALAKRRKKSGKEQGEGCKGEGGERGERAENQKAFWGPGAEVKERRVKRVTGRKERGTRERGGDGRYLVVETERVIVSEAHPRRAQTARRYEPARMIE